MPTLAGEIGLIEMFSKSKVVAITLNHEDMSDDEVAAAVIEYEILHELPVTDVLTSGCSKLILKLFEVFPVLLEKALVVCQRQE